MSALIGKTLLTQDGTKVKADDVLAGKEKIALYTVRCCQWDSQWSEVQVLLGSLVPPLSQVHSHTKGVLRGLWPL